MVFPGTRLASSACLGTGKRAQRLVARPRDNVKGFPAWFHNGLKTFHPASDNAHMARRKPCPRCRRLAAENRRLKADLQHLAAKVTTLTATVAALRARGKVLQAQVSTLRAEVRTLREELRRAKRKAAPFARERPKTDPKPPGRKPGHTASFRATPPPEAVTETFRVPLRRCPDCGGPVERIKDNQPVFQTDLPPIKPIVRRFDTQRGWCPRCRKAVRSRHPLQTSTAAGAAAPPPPLSLLPTPAA